MCYNLNLPGTWMSQMQFYINLLVTSWQEVLGGFLFPQKIVLNMTYGESFINFYFVWGNIHFILGNAKLFTVMVLKNTSKGKIKNVTCWHGKMEKGIFCLLCAKEVTFRIWAKTNWQWQLQIFTDLSWKTLLQIVSYQKCFFVIKMNYSWKITSFHSAPAEKGLVCLLKCVHKLCN